MTFKDYLENNIGISIGGSYLKPYATIYPTKPRSCERHQYNGTKGRDMYSCCVLYDYKTKQCRCDFKCDNGKPLEKCYKFISQTKCLNFEQEIGDRLCQKIIELRAKKY